MTRFARLRVSARGRTGAARAGTRRRLLGAGTAAVVALGTGIPLVISGSATAHATSHEARVAHFSAPASVLAKLPAQARNAIRARERMRGRRYFDGLGIRPGKIKHVWLIILENKSYDASFTGLNNNTYLWKTLPSQGVLLKNY